ncbi:hypothetical protein [Streptomyces sp. 061-3]|uniref:hypothetical protein n=1 Tax=Streptomyces sp. 061-3 TaxID=2789268 RepID=UPI00397F2D8C
MGGNNSIALTPLVLPGGPDGEQDLLPMMTTPGAHGTSREPAVGARVNLPDRSAL